MYRVTMDQINQIPFQDRRRQLNAPVDVSAEVVYFLRMKGIKTT